MFLQFFCDKTVVSDLQNALILPAMQFTDFFNSRQTYFIYDEDSRYICKRFPLTSQILAMHLKGDITLAASAVSPHPARTCRWIALDSDRADGKLRRVTAGLEAAGLKFLYESQRPGRDGHAWMVMDEPIPALTAWKFGRLVQHFFDIPINDDHFSIIPMHQNAFEPENVGSSLRAPCGVHPKPESGHFRCWFEGSRPTLEGQAKFLAQQSYNDHRLIIDAVIKEERVLNKIILNPPGAATPGQNEMYSLLVSHGHLIKLRGNAVQKYAQCPVCLENGSDKRGKNNLSVKFTGDVLSPVRWRCQRGCKANDIFSTFKRLISES